MPPSAARKDRGCLWGWYEWRRMKALQRRGPIPLSLAIANVGKATFPSSLSSPKQDDLHERRQRQLYCTVLAAYADPRCFTCGQAHTFAPSIPDEPEGGRRLSPPVCRQCGGHTRPGVVWFGEDLPVRELHRAYAQAKQCDLFFSIGFLRRHTLHPRRRYRVWQDKRGQVVQITTRPPAGP
ncbi:MAG: hypothetical protein IPJ48_17335 [Propionivibrio sp.]|uniref:Uncharacterized protein n=1 Tax=Candidatus Propionivibrio dominans TaxID=2954373 RepID=A0A9D7IE14_9RHOO|nr:hypothetical protein [Candidatus Propionivibrio dominans]